MKIGRFGWFVLASFVVLIFGLGIVVLRDELNMRRVKPGMAVLEVERTVGKPTHVLRDDWLVDAALAETHCDYRQVRECYYYRRYVGPNLIVAFDEGGRATCVSRLGAISVDFVY